MLCGVQAKAKRRHLNAADCDELRRSAEGIDALTHPHAVNLVQGNRYPNRGLCPNTPTKRQKCTSTLGSPSGQQKCINNVLSVRKIISSSPYKSSQPSSSTHTNGINGEPETKQTLVVDYLEGMTSEMFGDDDEFDPFDIHNEDEEVEALPDSHFGLLGSSRELLQPQGCIEYLPEEVLRQILCSVPAQDLYRNVSLVCHRWRNIVQDPKVEQTTELYYVLLAESILSFFYGLTKVVLMAQHKVGERLRPEVVLEHVQKHRLFPQAEASIRLRIPDIQKSFNLGIEGPNPYAAMAVILILSENVGDVQALVSLLRGCMSETAITEYLSHMATMLLAVKRSNIQISNRAHYNIYYVLHLMMNGPFPVTSVQQPQMHLTHEQQQILSHNIQQDHVVKIVAFAGTGKTTTLVKYAEQRPHLRFLYVAFNKSVAIEAQRRFPRNVACKTVHSLAFSDVGKRYHFRRKLTPSLKPFALNFVLPEGRGGFSKAKVVATTLNTFMASTDQTITIRHVPNYRLNKRADREEIRENEKPFFVHDAQLIWSKMKDLNVREKAGYYMTHDGYLKLWQLQIPKPQLSDHYDVLFIDEAQDCTPAIMDVLLSQHCAKILVGDPHQQIYTFKGAVNALSIVEHTHIYFLTQSFRFGAEIAYVGATILKVCKNVQKILVGGKGKTAILSRCNLTVFNEAAGLIDRNPCCHRFWLPVSTCIRDPLIRSFVNRGTNPFWALKKYVTQTEDRELESKVSIVETYGVRIPKLVKTLERSFESDLNKADFIIGTVHKAKGLEFDSVVVSDDFIKIPCSRHNLCYNRTFSFANVPDDEWNLLYVAVTRAKTTLIITKTIRRILSWAGVRHSLTMPSALTSLRLQAYLFKSTGIFDIISSSVFVSVQTDGVSEGGPLCERCVWSRIGPTAFLMTDDVVSMAAIPNMMVPGFF
uniref:DNA 3'-5' helicase n=1 Tax=Mola mola TaxID=94237 RepID=A0A3Q3WVL0_MOLML